MARFTRRELVTSALGVAAVAGFGALALRTRSIPSRIEGQPVLRMPVPSGTVVMCQQGNLQPAPRTHSADNCLHALDLANLALVDLPVVAAADGRVGFVFDAATPGDFEAGARFGNHVTIAHEGGVYTLYAHLREIAVRVDQRVRSGEAIGLAGMTGAAGNRHLHFALHRGEPGGPGAPDTIPIRALLAAPVGDGEPMFEILRGASVRSGENLWSGGLYASENAIDAAPRAGPLDDLRAAIDDGAKRAKAAALTRAELETFKVQWEDHDAAWAEARLAPALEAESAVADYWWAIAVELARGEIASSKGRLSASLLAADAQPTWETWLEPAIHMRLGGIELSAGDLAAARAHFTSAAKSATSPEIRRAAREALRELDP